MNRKLKLSALGVIFIVIILMFLSGSPVLVKELFGLPVGNILVWIGLVALQLFFYFLNFGFKKGRLLGKILRILMLILIVISILWFPISYFLSGNINFNFSSSATTFQGSPRASIVYWNLIYSLIILPIILTLIYQIVRIFNKRKTK